MGNGNGEMGTGNRESQFPTPESQLPNPKKISFLIEKILSLHSFNCIRLRSSTDRMKDSGSLDLGSIPNGASFLSTLLR